MDRHRNRKGRDGRDSRFENHDAGRAYHLHRLDTRDTGRLIKARAPHMFHGTIGEAGDWLLGEVLRTWLQVGDGVRHDVKVLTGW